jgi:adenine/guanine/hypoxanthine permease
MPRGCGCRWDYRGVGGGVALGIGLAWLLRAFGLPAFEPPAEAGSLGWHWPTPVPRDLFALLTSATGWQYLAVIFPMGLFNVVGSLQNLESAEAAGDRFDTRSSLLVNGARHHRGRVASAAPFPRPSTSGIRVGKRWAPGRDTRLLNGVAITLLCLVGGMGAGPERSAGRGRFRDFPLDRLIITRPGLSGSAQDPCPGGRPWPGTRPFGLGSGAGGNHLRVAGSTLFEAAPRFGADLFVHGIIALNQGFLLTSMILAALLVQVIERRFLKAALWAGIAAMFSWTGLIHAYELTPAGVQNKFGFGAATGFRRDLRPQRSLSRRPAFPCPASKRVHRVRPALGFWQDRRVGRGAIRVRPESAMPAFVSPQAAPVPADGPAGAG